MKMERIGVDEFKPWTNQSYINEEVIMMVYYVSKQFQELVILDSQALSIPLILRKSNQEKNGK